MTLAANEPRPRWQDYVLIRGNRFSAFWKGFLQKAPRSFLFVVGRGFDPRMCLGSRQILEAGGIGPRDLIALEFDEGPTSPSLVHKDQVEKNWVDLQSIFSGRGKVSQRLLTFWSPEGRRVSSQNALDLFDASAPFSNYTDIVVDISAMPRSVYFPLLARLLFFLDTELASQQPPKNLFVIVAEDAGLDAAIQEEGVDERAEFMASFGGGFDEEATQIPKVWIPLLGENRTTQFDRIENLVDPDEICPVLPSPSRNIRRADDIVIQYQRVLFDELRLDPRAFLHASEQNPFEVYRQIRKAVLHFASVFKLLDGCKVALSALSSKLMSLGALLVAYELKQLGYNIGVAHIECQGYALVSKETDSELFSLWLAGECYAA
jgi:hypothetical protein